MKRNGNLKAWLIVTLAGIMILPGVCAALPQAQSTQQPPAPKYTPQEYRDFQAARAETNAQQKLKLLDDFVAKYPNSDLLVFIYPEYAAAYKETKNWPKVVESYDKVLSFPNLDPPTRLNNLYGRAVAFGSAYNPKAPNAREQAAKAVDACKQGLQTVEAIAKPENVTAEQFTQKKKEVVLLFLNTAAFASLQNKDERGGIDYYKQSLKLDPNQSVVAYQMGRAYLLSTPAQSIDGFWMIARAISLKIPSAPAVEKYLKQEVNKYELPSCDSSVDAQVKELIALAASQAERPASYSIPSAADLVKAREQANIATVLADLKAGGDKAKLTWLAVCSGGFPEALGKVFEVASGSDTVTIKAYAGTTEEEVQAATVPNVELKVAGQPEASRLQKHALFRFGGALVEYIPDPLLMRWDKVKINAEDIPEDKTAKPGKKAGKAPAKHPAKKAAPQQ